jgi:hypothetical protein
MRIAMSPDGFSKISWQRTTWGSREQNSGEELAKPGNGEFMNELLLNETVCFEILELYVAKLTVLNTLRVILKLWPLSGHVQRT